MTHHTEIFHTRHCTYNLHVHLVFVVKYRKKIFTAEILKDLKIIFGTICLELDADLIEFDGEPTIVKQIETAFRRDEKVLRFLVFRLDKNAAEYAANRRSLKSAAKATTIE